MPITQKMENFFNSAEYQQWLNETKQWTKDFEERTASIEPDSDEARKISGATLSAIRPWGFSMGMQHSMGDLYISRKAYGAALGLGQEDLIARAREILKRLLTFEANLKGLDKDYPEKEIAALEERVTGKKIMVEQVSQPSVSGVQAAL
jgi:hypothetical protein